MKIVVEVVMMRMVILCVRIVLVWEREELEKVVRDKELRMGKEVALRWG